MRLPGRTKQQPPAEPPPAPPRGELRQRLRKAEREVTALRQRVEQLEHEVFESRRLNKQIAEMIDVVGEVLLPAEQRDEQRLHALLKRYESTL
jgi:hypothetical protein